MPLNAPPGPHRLTLRLLPETLAVCCLPADAPVPGWAVGGDFHAITRTADELSIVCACDAVPSGILHEAPWRCLEVEGPLDFALTGILASLAAPLAAAGIPIFALSTYRTDYLLVPGGQVDSAVQTLCAAGFRISENQTNRG